MDLEWSITLMSRTNLRVSSWLVSRDGVLIIFWFARVSGLYSCGVSPIAGAIADTDQRRSKNTDQLQLFCCSCTISFGVSVRFNSISLLVRGERGGSKNYRRPGLPRIRVIENCNIVYGVFVTIWPQIYIL